MIPLVGDSGGPQEALEPALGCLFELLVGSSCRQLDSVTRMDTGSPEALDPGGWFKLLVTQAGRGSEMEE